MIASDITQRIDALKQDRAAWDRLPAGRIQAQVDDLLLIVDTPCDTYTSMSIRSLRGGVVLPPRPVGGTAEGINKVCDAAMRFLVHGSETY